jgi:hypothetical protein
MNFFNFFQCDLSIWKYEFVKYEDSVKLSPYFKNTIMQLFNFYPVFLYLNVNNKNKKRLKTDFFNKKHSLPP